MCVCIMYVCTYVRMYVCITYVRTYVCMYYVCTYVCMYVRTYVCITYVCIMYMCTYVRVCVYIYIYILKSFLGRVISTVPNVSKGCNKKGNGVSTSLHFMILVKIFTLDNVNQLMKTLNYVYIIDKRII